MTAPCSPTAPMPCSQTGAPEVPPCACISVAGFPELHQDVQHAIRKGLAVGWPCSVGSLCGDLWNRKDCLPHVYKHCCAEARGSGSLSSCVVCNIKEPEKVLGGCPSFPGGEAFSVVLPIVTPHQCKLLENLNFYFSGPAYL